MDCQVLNVIDTPLEESYRRLIGGRKVRLEREMLGDFSETLWTSRQEDENDFRSARGFLRSSSQQWGLSWSWAQRLAWLCSRETGRSRQPQFCFMFDSLQAAKDTVTEGRDDLQPWIDDVVQTMYDLADRHARCCDWSDRLRDACYQSWNAAAIGEINRLRLSLLNIDAAAAAEFHSLALRCFALLPWKLIQ